MWCTTLAAGIGFISLGIYDIAQIRGWRRIGTLASIIGYGTIVSSIIFYIIHAPSPPGPVVIGAVGLIIATAGLIGLVYTVIFEVKRKPQDGPTDEPRRVYRLGSYGVVRHPGFWWYLLMCVALGGVYRATNMVVFLSLTVGMNFVLILLEDRYLFPRIFTDYGQYRRQVPFLIPREMPKKRVWPTS